MLIKYNSYISVKIGRSFKKLLGQKNISNTCKCLHSQMDDILKIAPVKTTNKNWRKVIVFVRGHIRQ